MLGAETRELGAVGQLAVAEVEARGDRAARGYSGDTIMAGRS